MFGTRVLSVAMAVAASLLLARLLGTAGQGEYSTVVAYLTLLLAFGQFGLPSAVTFFAGRGLSIRSLASLALRLGLGLSVLSVVASTIILPSAVRSVARLASVEDLALATAAIPFLLATSLMTSILIGRQLASAYNLVQIAQASAALAGIVLLVGALGLGVPGALTAYIAATMVGAFTATSALVRVIRRTEPVPTAGVSVQNLFGLAGRIMPGSIASYLNYRLDILMLNAFGDAAQEVGLYSRAANFAELLFYVPDSIATVFYPRVAGLSRVDAGTLAPLVTRRAVLLTLLGAGLLLPSSYLIIRLVIPAFLPAMVPLAVLIPGVISISVSKVLSSYVSGLGRPMMATIASSSAMILNLICNILLIPRFGIMGAAVSSLISYTFHGLAMVYFAGRISREPLVRFIIPTRAEVGWFVETSRSAVRATLDMLGGWWGTRTPHR